MKNRKKKNMKNHTEKHCQLSVKWVKCPPADVVDVVFVTFVVLKCMNEREYIHTLLNSSMPTYLNTFSLIYTYIYKYLRIYIHSFYMFLFLFVSIVVAKCMYNSYFLYTIVYKVSSLLTITTVTTKTTTT